MSKSTETLLAVLATRGLQFARLHHHYAIEGSPERCQSRHVAEDKKGRLWLVEHLAYGQSHSRQTVAKIMHDIAPYCDDWLPLPRYIEGMEERRYTESESVIIEKSKDEAGHIWQVSPFFQGLTLPRPDYLRHAWRGKAIAHILRQLHRASGHLQYIPPPQSIPAHALDLHGYMHAIANTLHKHHPCEAQKIETVIAHLDEVLPQNLAQQKMSLAHGDMHPLNIIWGEKNIVGLIDWEFCGARPMLYDMANCLACCGFEHPSGLVGPLAMKLTHEIFRGENAFLENSYASLLPDMLMALRFGWLAEWCKKKDKEMLAMELDYLHILLYNRELLIQQWSGAK